MAEKVQKVDIVSVPDDFPPSPVVAENVAGVKNLPPQTTAAEDRTTAGQRNINLMWEVVQGLVGLVLAFTACYSVIVSISLPAEFWLLLGIVVNSYFTRTNHTKIGGIGGTDSR